MPIDPARQMIVHNLNYAGNIHSHQGAIFIEGLRPAKQDKYNARVVSTQNNSERSEKSCSPGHDLCFVYRIC